MLCRVFGALRRRFTTSAPLDIDTNIAKDVILYQYENPRFFRVMNVCAITQYIFWAYMAYVSDRTVRGMPSSVINIDSTEDARLIDKFKTPSFMRKVVSVALVVGMIGLASSFMYTLRSVRYLVLNKGGRAVSFVTYTPVGPNRILTVDLRHVSCTDSRTTAATQLPIKVENRAFFYLLDMRGQFKNPVLFDRTVGVKRQFR